MAGKFQLIMRSGPTPGATYTLEGDLITVGRDSANTIQINDAEMSRRHARLQFQGGKYVIEDLGSTNGTHVNGQRLSGPSVLRTGDVVSFGEQIVLGFEASDFDPAATLASQRSAKPRQAAAAAAPPPPVQAYAGQFPEGPMQPARKTNPVPIIIGAVVVLCLCVGGVLLYFAPTSFWCIFPIWGPGACP
jgi:predicted component of type VI protein secretion system